MAPKLVKIPSPKEIQILIVEYTIDLIMLAKCQKKRNELGYNFINEFV